MQKKLGDVALRLIRRITPKLGIFVDYRFVGRPRGACYSASVSVVASVRFRIHKTGRFHARSARRRHSARRSGGVPDQRDNDITRPRCPIKQRQADKAGRVTAHVKRLTPWRFHKSAHGR